jgi:hypothetical protein
MYKPTQAIAIAVVLTMLSTVGIFSSSIGGTGGANVFSYHPALMSVSFFLLMALGLMLHSSEFTRLSMQAKRRLHGLIMMLAAAASAGGYAAINKAHAEAHLSQIAVGASAARALHVCMGYLVLAMVVGQVCVGVLKVLAKGRAEKAGGSPPPSLRWHGDLGRATFALGVSASVVGFWIEWNHDGIGWPASFKLLLTAQAVGLATFVLVLPRYQTGDGTAAHVVMTDIECSATVGTSAASAASAVAAIQQQKFHDELGEERTGVRTGNVNVGGGSNVQAQEAINPAALLEDSIYCPIESRSGAAMRLGRPPTGTEVAL